MSGALERAEGPARSHHRAGELEVSVAARMAYLRRCPRPNHRRIPGATTGRLRRAAERLSGHQLRAASARSSRDPELESGTDRPRRGPEDQKLGYQNGGLCEAVASPLSAGAHRNTNGEPVGGAGIHHGLGGRSGARTEMEARALALDLCRWRQGSSRRSQLGYASTAAGPLYGAQETKRGPEPASRKDRHGRPRRVDPRTAR